MVGRLGLVQPLEEVVVEIESKVLKSGPFAKGHLSAHCHQMSKYRASVSFLPPPHTSTWPWWSLSRSAAGAGSGHCGVQASRSLWAARQ